MRIEKAMRMNTGKVILLCVSLILTFASIDIGLGQPLTTVYVDPSETTVQQSSDFLIHIEIVDAIDLYSFNFQLSFDPSLMECVSAEWGDFPLPPPPIAPPPEWNNTEGRVWGGWSYMLPEPGAYGSGTLVLITFHCKEIGTGDLTFDYTELLDSFGGPISHIIEGGVVHQVETPTIGVSPPNITVWDCDTFIVNVTISNVLDLHSWEFNMTFDPSTMECLGVEEGPFLKEAGLTSFTPPTINNTAGTINGANCTTLFLPGVGGSGTLANVTFHCKGEGQSLLAFSYTRLLDSADDNILHGVAVGSVTQRQRQNVTYRLLAVEHYFNSHPMKSGQYLIQHLTSFKNWQNTTWGGFNYTSYIHLLSYDSNAQSSPYYTGPPTNSNVVNEITNFLAATLPGENNSLTIRIFYFIGHSGKRQFTVWPIPTPCQTYMCLGTAGSHPEGPTQYEELYGEQLDTLLTSGDLQNSNCTLVLLDTCYSGGYLNSTANYVGLNHPGHVVLTATDSVNLAYGWFTSPNTEDHWGLFTGHQNAKYDDDTVFGPLGIIGGLLNANDTDSDGWRSAGEVFEFANKTTRWYSANQSTGHSAQSWMKKMYPQACYGVAGADIPLVMSTNWIAMWPGPGQTVILTPTPFSYNGRPLFKRSFQSSPWRMFGLNTNRTGMSGVSGPCAPNLVWSTSPHSSFSSSPAVVDQMVFIGSNTTPGSVYALDLATGDTVWSFVADGSIHSSPAVIGGSVFIGTLGGGGGGVFGTLYSLDEYTGLLRWNFTTPSGTGGIFASPVVDKGLVFIATMGGGGGGWVYALNATTGEPIWNFTAAGPIKSSPAVADNRVFVATMGGGGGGGGLVYALNTFTGSPEWPSPFETLSPVMATPVVADGMVFVATMGGGGGGGRVYALSESTGTPVWPGPFETAGPITSSPAVDSSKGLVIVGSYEGMVYGLEEGSGMPLWSHPTGPINLSSPAISSNGYVYIGSTDSYVYCLNETSGDEVWIYGTGSQILSSPALTDDHVLIASMNERVYCFGPPFQVNNVAVLSVNAYPSLAFTSETVEITCIIHNKGNVGESFNVTIGYSNSSVWIPPDYLHPVVIYWEYISLDPGTSFVTYHWNTTGLSFGNYTISATAIPVPGETDTADNTLIADAVLVTIQGDITGPEGVPDGLVDIYDLALLGKAYGEEAPGSSSSGEELIRSRHTEERVLLVGLGIPAAICLLAFLWDRRYKRT